MSFLRKMKRDIWRKLRLSPISFEEKISPLVSSQANSIITTHRKITHDKALFIDMGSNLGQGFHFFSKYYDPNVFDYYLVEANPFCIEKLKSNVSKWYKKNTWNGKWKVMNVAISDEEGTLSLYGLSENRGNVSVGASVIKNHNSLFYDASESKALKVPAIRVSKLIEEASKKYATIVVKMDIESAEYDALEDLINTGCMEKISHIYIEWHAQYYSDNQIEDILIRENKIKETLSGKFTDWC